VGESGETRSKKRVHLEAMLACRVFGHRYRFGNEGTTMRWACERGCGAGGEKEYLTAAEARRYARAFDYDERDSTGKRAPFFGLLPLRLWRMMIDRMRREER
jgi:hypothetical protein